MRCSLARFLPDGAALGLLLVVTGVAAWPLVVAGTMVGQDTAAFFYPIFGALGERLRGFDLPGWNPHQFSGVPFAADPESGWLYLPAMLLFTLLPLTAAAKGWLLGHLLLAGLGTYGLARTLGVGVLGALAAATAYELSGLMYARTVCCPAYVQIMAWMPVVLLAAERAIVARGLLPRLAWWGAAGVALGQIMVAWLGQGAYYALLAFGGFVLYRTVVTPPPDARSSRQRVKRLALHGAVPVAMAFMLAAGALWPRLEYHARTNLADGYTGDLAAAAILGGWDARIAVGQLLNPSLYYAGGATLALALVGLVLARTRYAAPYFAALSIATVVLAQAETTWLHRPLYALLPRFEELHRHWPERDMVVFYLGPALLVGAAIDALVRRQRRRWIVAALAPLPLLVALWIDASFAPIASVALWGAGWAGSGMAVAAVIPPLRRVAVPLLIALIAAELLTISRTTFANAPYGGFHRVDLSAYYAASPAAEAIRAATTGTAGPARFFGYDPGILPPGGTPLYRYFFADPRAAALLVNNRATLLGLEDVQGYNPIQPRRYVEYLDALNGRPQEYHEGNVYALGLGSPLLDLLNARYIVVPAAFPPSRTDLVGLTETLPTVYGDPAVRVLERPQALPRAWLVHEARQVSDDEALRLLASGAVDPRQVALVDAEPPALAPASNPTGDRAEVVRREADQLRIAVSSDAPALLVLSETADPGWTATVDGRASPILTADYLFRAVAVPAGVHEVEFRYAPASLRVGTAVSVFGYAVVIATWALACRADLRARRSAGG